MVHAMEFKRTKPGPDEEGMWLEVWEEDDEGNGVLIAKVERD